MVRSLSTRTRQFVVLVTVTTAFFTVAYNMGMATWEERPQRLIQSLEVIIQSFTTTGYWQDAPWETTQMNLLVIGMQLAGVGLILAAINAIVVPWFRKVLEASPPTRGVELKDHVVVCGVTPRTEAFESELELRGRAFVFVEPDVETATEFHHAGIPVIHGDPESIDVLGRANVDRATAVVADAADDVNASIALSVREAHREVRVIVVGEDRDLREYQRIAGSDEILSPCQLFGESLADRTHMATTNISERIPITDEFEVAEISVTDGSSFSGTTLADCQFRDRFGVRVLGAWSEDGIVERSGPDFVIDPSPGFWSRADRPTPTPSYPSFRRPIGTRWRAMC